MSSIVTPPNPSLLGILLLVQSRSGSGSRLVFHYPPDPLSPDASHLRWLGGSASYEDVSSSSSSDGETSTEEDVAALKGRPAKDKSWRERSSWTSPTDEYEDDIPAREGVDNKDDAWTPPWEPLLGLGSDGLVGVLTPDRSWHKRKFEIGINDLCFLGWPLFVRDDGNWKKKKSSKKARLSHGLSSPLSHDDHTDRHGEETTTESSATEPDTESEIRKSDLTMFHVVFVMNPPAFEHTLRVKEMYNNVVKKFGRVLKYEQDRIEYVWREAELMQSITSEHISKQSATSSMYAELLTRSSLATAISTVFTAISASRIASITLSPTVSLSLQIPPITYTSVLPSLTDPPTQVGIWLTTANNPTSTTSDLDTPTSSGTAQLAKHFTLLLKSPKQKILKDFQSAGAPRASLLSKVVAVSTPMKSFHKISLASHIPFPEIHDVARHLIDWRRAVAIPPLHRGDTYIVSPIADMTKLKAASKAYESAFPTLPSLPKVLSMLSDTPSPFRFMIPSTDHKDAYHEVLAWLMRGSWVTQLRTFALLRADPAVKKAAKDKETKDEKRRKESESLTHTDEFSGEYNTDPKRRPSMYSHSSSETKTISTTTNTSINDQNGRHPDNPNLASLILNPTRASPLESSWLDYIADVLLPSVHPHLSHADQFELSQHWTQFNKYFNGTEALERIPVREGVKRVVVWEALARMGLDFAGGVERADGEQGFLVVFRHW